MLRKNIFGGLFKCGQTILIKNTVKCLSVLKTENTHIHDTISDDLEDLPTKSDYLKLDVINDKICQKLSNHSIYGSIKDFKRLVIVLRHNGLPSNDIINLLPTKLVHKMDSSNENWKSALDFLKSLGFSRTTRLKALSICPQLIEGDSQVMNSILKVMAILRSFNIFDNQAHLILTSNPLLLTSPSSKINIMHQNLLKYFTKLDVQKLILKSPTILTDDWEETEKKIFYSHITMGIPGKEISQCKYFSWSFREIIIRHLFLERSGLFKTMKIKTSKSTSVKSRTTTIGDSLTKENPLTVEIFNHSDKNFAVKTCGMTLAEFATFSRTLGDQIDEIETELELTIRKRGRESAKHQPTPTHDEDDDEASGDDSDDDDDK